MALPNLQLLSIGPLAEKRPAEERPEEEARSPKKRMHARDEELWFDAQFIKDELRDISGRPQERCLSDLRKSKLLFISDKNIKETKTGPDFQRFIDEYFEEGMSTNYLTFMFGVVAAHLYGKHACVYDFIDADGKRTQGHDSYAIFMDPNYLKK